MTQDQREARSAFTVWALFPFTLTVASLIVWWILPPTEANDWGAGITSLILGILTFVWLFIVTICHGEHFVLRESLISKLNDRKRVNGLTCEVIKDTNDRYHVRCKKGSEVAYIYNTNHVYGNTGDYSGYSDKERAVTDMIVCHNKHSTAERLTEEVVASMVQPIGRDKDDQADELLTELIKADREGRDISVLLRDLQKIHQLA